MVVDMWIYECMFAFIHVCVCARACLCVCLEDEQTKNIQTLPSLYGGRMHNKQSKHLTFQRRRQCQQFSA